jgi:hypothetical protein
MAPHEPAAALRERVHVGDARDEAPHRWVGQRRAKSGDVRLRELICERAAHRVAGLGRRSFRSCCGLKWRGQCEIGPRMRRARRVVILAVLALLSSGSWSATAAVFCRKGARLAVRDGTCKRKETALDLAGFGAVGPPGPPGPPGPSSALSTTVTGLGPSGSRIVNDADTGLEVTWGLNAIHTQFVNHNATVPIHVRGVAMYNDSNTGFLDFEIAPFGTVPVVVAAVGTTWFDVLAVTVAPVADVRRLRVTCSFIDSATPDNVAWSCIGTR